MRQLALFSVVLGTLAGYTGAGVGLGWIAWKKWGAPSWVIAVTSAIGLALAFYRVYLVSRRMMQSEDGS